MGGMRDEGCIEKRKKRNQKSEIDADLKIARVPPIKNLPEKIAELTKGEEEAIAKIGGQGGQVWDGNHLDLYLPGIVKLFRQWLDLEAKRGLPFKLGMGWRIALALALAQQI